MLSFFRKNKKIDNIEEVLKHLEKLEKENSLLKREIEEIKRENFSFIKKIKLSRYNPFSEIGGNQSFSVLLLNKENDGIIITGLYTENGSRVYAKSIEKGISNYSLSKEEEVILKEII